MSISDYNLSCEPKRLKTQLKPTYLDVLMQREERLQNMFSSPLYDSLRKQETLIQRIHPSPIVEAFQAQQNMLPEQLVLNNAITINPSAIIEKALPLQHLADAQNISSQVLPAYNIIEDAGQMLGTFLSNYREMSRALSSGLAAYTSELNLVGETLCRLTKGITQSVNELRRTVEPMVKGLAAFCDAINNTDFSYLLDFSNQCAYMSTIDEKNEILKSFGWFLIPELPEEIIEEIYARRDAITQEEVDTLIVRHFRNNRCQELKSIVNKWNNLPYFESRKIVFHEAQVCHSRRSFNASTTLISLHFEGVVTDFVRDRLNSPTYRVKNALKCINDLTGDLTLQAMSFQEWKIRSFILECVDRALTAEFSPADPDSCPNMSRHKIAHGHATAKETEANSLRRFLFMNELYKLFCCLENEYQLAS